ncbi:hypothetical protein K432DRAFT_286605 [Lepidopterella palustris CBS 459.81]|uniref:EthD domain-containing protein n=1 Tax=Lepidopterella palustris CBS 459.81 TaxID=1314670 RepID=A0A8E2EK64_9PEZI|nr:hypothetical protein K432DRAFT_286605 [Lepidopterella palustris CBS 459.81]
MASPSRADCKGEPLSGSGILWVNSKITAPDKVSPELFRAWYEEVHIPDILAAKQGGILASWRYQCADPERPAPYLAIYSVPDLGFLQSNEFKAIPMAHDMLPGGEPIHIFADFDAMVYKRVKVFEKGETKPGCGAVIITACIQPAAGMEQEFGRWYNEEHLEQVSETPGWRRSTRFELVFKTEDKDDLNREITPKYLAIHEFEDGSLPGERVQPLTPVTDWTEKMVGSAIKVDEAKFTLLRGFGDTNASI